MLSSRAPGQPIIEDEPLTIGDGACDGDIVFAPGVPIVVAHRRAKVVVLQIHVIDKTLIVGDDFAVASTARWVGARAGGTNDIELITIVGGTLDERETAHKAKGSCGPIVAELIVPVDRFAFGALGIRDRRRTKSNWNGVNAWGHGTGGLIRPRRCLGGGVGRHPLFVERVNVHREHHEHNAGDEKECADGGASYYRRGAFFHKPFRLQQSDPPNEL